MKDTLDQIEGRLQALIEKSILLLPGGHRQGQMVRQLVEAFRDILINLPGEEMSQAITLVIYLCPEDYSAWQTDPLLVDTLASAFSQSASEAGVQLSASPVIRLAADADLRPGILHVARGTPQPRTREIDLIPQLGSAQQDVYPSRKAFLIINDETVYPIDSSVVNIGRRSDNHLVLEDSRISRLHAQIRNVHNNYIVFDLNSTGGTFVNGKRITQHILRPGDVISIAGFPLVFGEDLSGMPGDADQTASFQKLPIHPKT